MNTIETNEKTTLLITVTFRDESRELIVPSTVEYRIDDIHSKTMIRNWTSLTPTDSTMDIEVTDEENALISSKRTYEDRMLTVRFTYPEGKGGLAQQIFRVNNVDFST
jgi:hypothetical protein